MTSNRTVIFLYLNLLLKTKIQRMSNGLQDTHLTIVFLDEFKHSFYTDVKISKYNDIESSNENTTLFAQITINCKQIKIFLMCVRWCGLKVG